MKIHKIKYVIIVILQVAIVFPGFGKKQSKKWFESLGFQSSLGYAQYFQKRILKPKDTYKFIKLKDVSYKFSFCYKFNLNKNLMLQPTIGYSFYQENTWTHGYNLWNKYYTSAFNIGCFMNYQLNKFNPKIGICALRINERKKISLIPYYSYNTYLDTRNFIQMQLGLDYEFKKFRIGLEFNRGITYVTYWFWGASPFSINYYAMTLTYYPFTR